MFRHLSLISPDKVNLCLLCVRGKDFVRGMNVVFQNGWTMDIGLNSPVVQHLTSDARAPGSIFSFVYLCTCSFLPSLLHYFIIIYRFMSVWNGWSIKKTRVKTYCSNLKRATELCTQVSIVSDINQMPANLILINYTCYFA